MANKKRKELSNKAPSLLKVLLLDIFVYHWMVTALAMLLVCCSMLLAFNNHDSRRLTAELQSLRNLHEEEQFVWNSYRLELTSLSESNRISNLAKKQLGMIDVKNHNEKVISL